MNGEPFCLKHASRQDDQGDGTLGAYVNARNDICISLKPSDKGAERKISGSAYKITANRAYHHGTMLLSSNLADLGAALRPSRAAMISKGVASVPSPVCNLVDAFASRASLLHHHSFCDAVVAEFRRTYGHQAVTEHVDESNYSAILGDTKGELLIGRKEMDSWDWTWGQTPEFSHTVHYDGNDVLPQFSLELHVKNGLIQSTCVRTATDTSGTQLHDLVSRFKHARYNVLADAPPTFTQERLAHQHDITSDEEVEEGIRELKLDQQSPLQQMARYLLPWLKTVL